MGSACSKAKQYNNTKKKKEQLFVYNANNQLPSTTTSVIFTSNITTIGASAFIGCDTLTSITSSSSSSVDASSSLSFTNTVPAYVSTECNSLAVIALPLSVTSIGEAAFSQCTALSTITLPPSITIIDKHAFSHCYSLTFITLSSTPINTINEYTFCQCTSLISITLPNCVTTIKECAFSYCKSLQSMDLSLTVVKRIDKRAFSHCLNLISIKMPHTLTTISCKTFDNCPNLSSITIPSNNKGLIITTTEPYQHFEKQMINSHMGALLAVIQSMEFLTPISIHLFQCLNLFDNNNTDVTTNSRAFINWNECSKTLFKNTNMARQVLCTAAQENIQWSNGLSQILTANPNAININTEFQVFLLAAQNDDLETIYQLLQYHPTAILPYMTTPTPSPTFTPTLTQ